MASCSIVDKAFNDLWTKGVLKEGKTKIQDPVRFETLNKMYSDAARNKFNVTNPGLLFNISTQTTSHTGPLTIYSHKGDDSFNNDYAILNKEFVDEFQEKFDKYNKEQEDLKYSKITPTNELKTWELGDYKGLPQTKEEQHKIDNILIEHPNQKVGGKDNKGIEGESFNEFKNRIIAKMSSIVMTADPNTIVLTHNSVFGLIKLWDKSGRPTVLSKDFRTIYTKQDSTTGDYFTIKGNNGPIYIVRHGQTDDNKSKANPTGNFRRDDVNLTAKGIDQASQVGKDLRSINIPEIISSSLPRAIHTSQLILDQSSFPTTKAPVSIIKLSVPLQIKYDDISNEINTRDYSPEIKEYLIKELNTSRSEEDFGELLKKLC